MSSKNESMIKSSVSHKDIMSDIKKSLEKKKISYSASQSEIFVENGDKKEIKKIVESLPISKDDLWLLIEIVKAKNNVYIRQKISS